MTCSYDEILQFKKSAAVSSAKDLAEQGMSDAKHGLVQVVSDNFDTDISSPNGKASTHSLAMIVMQPTCDNHPAPDAAIRRLQRDKISQAIQETIGEQSSVYYGQKNTAMPQVPTPSLPSDFTMHQDVSRRLAAENDFAFFKNILTCGDCPEYEIRMNASIVELLRQRGNINGSNWHTRNTQHCVWGCAENIDRKEIPTECPCIHDAS